MTKIAPIFLMVRLSSRTSFLTAERATSNFLRPILALWISPLPASNSISLITFSIERTLFRVFFNDVDTFSRIFFSSSLSVISLIANSLSASNIPLFRPSFSAFFRHFNAWPNSLVAVVRVSLIFISKSFAASPRFLSSSSWSFLLISGPELGSLGLQYFDFGMITWFSDSHFLQHFWQQNLLGSNCEGGGGPMEQISIGL